MSKGHKIFNKSSRNYGMSATGSPYCSVVPPGALVTVTLNNMDKTLAFNINGTDCGIAHREVEGRLFPFLTLYGEASSGTLVQVDTTRLADPLNR